MAYGCADARRRLIPAPRRGAQPRGDEHRGTPVGRLCPVRDRQMDGRRSPSHAGSHLEEAGLPAPRPTLPPALRLAGDSPACARPQALPGLRSSSWFLFGSSSWVALVPLQLQFLAAPAHGRLGLVSAPVRCGCSSVADSQAQLLDGSSSVLAPAPSPLQCSLISSSVCCFSSSSAPADFHIQFLCGSGSFPSPARGRLQLLLGFIPSPLQLVLVETILALGKAVIDPCQNRTCSECGPTEEEAAAGLPAPRPTLRAGDSPACARPAPAPAHGRLWEVAAPVHLRPQFICTFSSSSSSVSSPPAPASQFQLVLVKTILALGKTLLGLRGSSSAPGPACGWL